MKGIVLAGGTGSRLWPSTKSVSKQLLPIYDKPMIYYPVSTLIDAGIDDFLIITSPGDLSAFQNLLGDGSRLGLSFRYEVQASPDGLAQAFTIGREFLNGDSVALILGDNIFHGSNLGEQMRQAFIRNRGCQIFTYRVANPSDYGVLTLDKTDKPIDIIEKPVHPESNLAITGVYYFNNKVSDLADNLRPSPRGELEITDLIKHYLLEESLEVNHLPDGTAWLDSGTHASLHDASIYIKVIEDRTGRKIGSIEESAWRQGKISSDKLLELASSFGKSTYGQYLKSLLENRETRN
jgi:glucose-1-phosphate thymidylyltransferase